MEYNNRSRRMNFEDLKPSKVVHVRELAEHTLEIDLVKCFENFGPIRDIVMIPKKRQALIEFENITSSQKLVENYRNDSILIAGKAAKINYSTSEHVVKKIGNNEGASIEKKVLIFFIYDVLYPINVDIIQKICRPHGRVSRIFISRKNDSLNVLVEFFTLEEAKIAKQNLNGADIYSGCCTLKIEFASSDKVTVNSNSEDTYNIDLDVPEKVVMQSLLGAPRHEISMGYQPLANNGPPPSKRGYYDYNMGDYPPRNERMMAPLQATPDYRNYDSMVPQFQDHGHKVAIIYGLNMDFINCLKLFNLLCLYGNVERIKFLKTMEGSALVQMGDSISMNKIIEHLHQVTICGQQIQVQVSKQPVLNAVPQPYKLKDGTDSFRDFIGCRENRFSNPDFASKHRISSPSRTLNYWNAPPNFTFEQLQDLISSTGTTPPNEHHQLTSREKSSSGLIQWDKVEDAISCVIVCNHMLLEFHAAKTPYQLKLGFSENPIRLKRSDEEADGDFRPKQAQKRQYNN